MYLLSIFSEIKNDYGWQDHNLDIVVFIVLYTVQLGAANLEKGMRLLPIEGLYTITEYYVYYWVIKKERD